MQTAEGSRPSFDPTYLKEYPKGISIEVKVLPRSSQNKIVGEQDGALKVKLTAPPVDGAANATLLQYFSQLLRLPKRDISLVKGETSKRKTIEITGISKYEFLKRTGLI